MRTGLLASIGAFSLLLAIPADSATDKRKPIRTKTKVTRKKPAVPPAPNVLPEYKNLPILGSYTLRPGNGKENFAIRVVFRPDGTWTWVGPDFRSEGRYWFKENSATLDYRKIDGKPTKPGTVRAKFEFLDNRRAFVVDNRVYGKKGTPDYVPPVSPTTETATPPPASPPPRSL